MYARRRSIYPLLCDVLLPVALVLLAVTGLGAQQTGSVTGLIRDTNLQPVSGVQVFIADLAIGALSNTSGRYVLDNIPVGVVTVQTQRIGFSAVQQTVTVMPGQSLSLNFSIDEQALELDEIVVTGTPGGTQRRAIGNLVERLSADDLMEVAGINNVQQLFSNRVSGMTTHLQTGEVGGDGAKIRIRGASSMGVKNDPIIYIDGIRINSEVRAFGSGGQTRLNDINPADIASVEIIKGPAAATLYGTEASNGVIQIITKRGITGAPVFNASAEFGANWFPNPRRTVGRFWDVDPITGEVFSANLWDTELAVGSWQGEPGKPMYTYGPIKNYSLSVTGGSDLIRYYASINKDDQQGYVPWNTDDKWSGRLGLDLVASETLNISMNMAQYHQNTRSATRNIWRTVVSAQIATLDDPKRRGFGVELIDDQRNGLRQTLATDRTSLGVQLAYVPLSWLSTRLVVGSDLTNELETQLTFREDDAPRGTFGSNGLGLKINETINTTLTTVDLSGTARFRFSDDRLGTAFSSGFQYYKKDAVTEELRGEVFATRALTTIGAAATSIADEIFIENTTIGAYVQQEIDWQERVFLTGAVRADDNSAFGEKFDVAIYPKVSATWVMSEESFWNLDAVDQLRVRGAWGEAGQQPDVFAATTLYRTRAGPGGAPILTPQTLGNSELGPERGSEIELGFDASILNGWADLNYTYYRKTTTDAITPTTLIPSLGFPGTQFINVGKIKNWGHELSLGVQLLSRDRLGWDVALSAATMRNRIEDLGDEISLLARSSSSQYHVVGYPLAGFWVQKVVSAKFLNGISGAVDPASVLCDGGTDPVGPGFAGPRGGTAVPCDGAPRVYMGRGGEPTWSFNLSSTLRLFDNWRLFATVDARGGNKRMSQSEAARATTWASVRDAAFQDDPIFMAQRSKNRTGVGIYDSGFARLREVALSYTLSASLVERIGASAASVNFAVRNLGLIWQEQKFMDVSEMRVTSPENRSINTEFDGHNHTQPPPMSQAVVRMTVTF